MRRLSIRVRKAAALSRARSGSEFTFDFRERLLQRIELFDELADRALVLRFTLRIKRSQRLEVAGSVFTLGFALRFSQLALCRLDFDLHGRLTLDEALIARLTFLETLRGARRRAASRNVLHAGVHVRKPPSRMASR